MSRLSCRCDGRIGDRCAEISDDIANDSLGAIEALTPSLILPRILPG